MSRSRKKSPIFGYASADSEAPDKRIWHSRMRHRERQALHTVEDFDTHLTTTDDQVSSTWDGQGRQTFLAREVARGNGCVGRRAQRQDRQGACYAQTSVDAQVDGEVAKRGRQIATPFSKFQTPRIRGG